MHHSIAILALAAMAAAAPFTGPTLCPAGLYSNPQCCATDILGVADLDCAVPPTAPSGVDSFIDTCGSVGQRARCCVIHVAGQAVLCQGVSPGGSDGGAPAPGPTGAPGGGAPGGGAPGGGAPSTPCESGAVAPTPTHPAPEPPVASPTDCGC
ncbi:hypothetical protein ACN47E_005272 [Coniothyrium glycines]